MRGLPAFCKGIYAFSASAENFVQKEVTEWSNVLTTPLLFDWLIGCSLGQDVIKLENYECMLTKIWAGGMMMLELGRWRRTPGGGRAGPQMRRFVMRQKFSLVRPEIELLTRSSGTSEIWLVPYLELSAARHMLQLLSRARWSLLSQKTPLPGPTCEEYHNLLTDKKLGNSNRTLGEICTVHYKVEPKVAKF